MPAYESRAELDEVLARLAGLLEKDPAFLKGSRGKNFTVAIDISDLGSRLHVGLYDGRVAAGLVRPPESPTIELVLGSEVFDGVFSGRTNPMGAAMSGALRFKGNKATALRFQVLLPDFIRLYKQARAGPR